MIRAPSSRRQLLSTLRVLAMRHPASREELDALVNDCTLLSRHIQHSPALVDKVPEEVWHFLSDPDIRFKDPRYAAIQLEGLRSVLEKWERESAG